MKITDKELHKLFQNSMECEDQIIRKEMENVEEHIFSEKFNQKMDKLFADIDRNIERTKKRKKRKAVLYRVAPVALILVAVVVGLVINVNSTTLNASDPSISITSWCKDFFSFTGEKDDAAEAFAFDEAQIGYIPEGFKKTEENITSSYIVFRYENEVGNYVYVKSSANNTATNANNTEIIQDIRVNEDGLEYCYTEDYKNKEIKIIFQGNNQQYYSIVGTVSEKEIIKVMDGIDH